MREPFHDMSNAFLKKQLVSTQKKKEVGSDCHTTN